eukprot:67759-Hanusia_phi.AAC.1
MSSSMLTCSCTRDAMNESASLAASHPTCPDSDRACPPASGSGRSDDRIGPSLSLSACSRTGRPSRLVTATR